jgi:hypothetical protein
LSRRFSTNEKRAIETEIAEMMMAAVDLNVSRGYCRGFMDSTPHLGPHHLGRSKDGSTGSFEVREPLPPGDVLKN